MKAGFWMGMVVLVVFGLASLNVSGKVYVYETQASKKKPSEVPEQFITDFLVESTGLRYSDSAITTILKNGHYTRKMVDDLNVARGRNGRSSSIATERLGVSQLGTGELMALSGAVLQDAIYDCGIQKSLGIDLGNCPFGGGDSTGSGDTGSPSGGGLGTEGVGSTGFTSCMEKALKESAQAAPNKDCASNPLTEGSEGEDKETEEKAKAEAEAKAKEKAEKKAEAEAKAKEELQKKLEDSKAKYDNNKNSELSEVSDNAHKNWTERDKQIWAEYKLKKEIIDDYYKPKSSKMPDSGNSGDCGTSDHAKAAFDCLWESMYGDMPGAPKKDQKKTGSEGYTDPNPEDNNMYGPEPSWDNLPCCEKGAETPEPGPQPGVGMCKSDLQYEECRSSTWQAVILNDFIKDPVKFSDHVMDRLGKTYDLGDMQNGAFPGTK